MSTARGVSPYRQPLSVFANAQAIRQEVQRFESVHPSIYALYDLIDLLLDADLQDQMRDHVIHIEDSFVNSQEWTLGRAVTDLRLGVLGTFDSGKSSLVHRYLTGSYLQEESSEGGRFKKEVVINDQTYLLLIRDEGGPPDLQFSQWVDAVILTFSLESEISFNTVYSYYSQMANNRRGLRDIPLILVGTQDSISEANPRIIDDCRSKLLAAELKCCSYFETCATYGLNVDRVFQDACHRIVSTLEVATPLAPLHCAVPQHMSPNRRPLATQSVRERGSSKASHSISNPMLPVANRSSAGAINSVQNIKAQSPPFREPTPSSGSEAALPVDHCDRCNRATFQQQQQMPMNAAVHNHQHLNAHGDKLPPQIYENSGHQRDSSSPPSTPGPLRKPGSFKNVPKSGSFSGNALFRYASQSDLPTGYNERQKAMPHFNLQAAVKSKPGKTLSERFDSFLKELSRDRSSSLTDRVRSYSVQVLEQSADSSRDFSSPCTTPTPVRKNRRRSNIFSKKDGDDKKLKNGDAKLGHGRVIPLKQGLLYKQSSKPLGKDWQKKYVTLLDDGCLTYHSSIHDYMENNHGKEIKLFRTTVKIPGQRPRGSEASSSSNQLAAHRASNGQVNNLLDSSFEASQQNSQTEAVVIPNASVTSGTLTDSDGGIFSSSVPTNLGSFLKTETPNVKKKHRRMKSTSKNGEIGLDADASLFEFTIVSLDNKQWQFAAQSAEDRDEWVSAIEQQILCSLQQIKSDKNGLSGVARANVLQSIRSAAGNGNCADCGAVNPDWASLNLGSLVCIACSGVHRNLGTHLSRVRSLELDDWPPELVKVMTAVGNKMVNSVWEACLKGRQKPMPSSTREEKDQWIRSKYEQKEFVAATPYSDAPLHRQLFDAVARKSVHDTLLVLAHSTPSVVNMPYSDTDTRTPIHIAAAIGHVVLLQLLVWNGANIELVDHEGFNAAYYADVSGSVECVQLLQSIQVLNTRS